MGDSLVNTPLQKAMQLLVYHRDRVINHLTTVRLSGKEASILFLSKTDKYEKYQPMSVCADCPG